MTSTAQHHLMPAQNTTKPIPATSTGEEVRAVAIFESRKGRRSRAWDELSEIDRQVLLEAVRQRRRYQARKASIYTELYGMRTNK